LCVAKSGKVDDSQQERVVGWFAAREGAPAAVWSLVRCVASGERGAAHLCVVESDEMATSRQEQVLGRLAAPSRLRRRRLLSSASWME
jgi:hypothetical protein